METIPQRPLILITNDDGHAAKGLRKLVALMRRFGDAMEILKVKRRTLRHYIYRGYLDRVYGGGCRAIGVTRESLLRFMTHRTVEHRGSDGITVTHGTACEVPGRSWARELK